MSKYWQNLNYLINPIFPYSKVGNSFSSHCHSATANPLKLTMDWQNVPIQCHWSLCVLEWSSCHLDQWRANARIVHQLSKMDVHSGATLPQPNLTAKHQVSGLILWPVSEGDRWCQSCTNANHSIVTWMPLYCHSDNISTPLPLNCHLTGVSIDCQSSVTELPIECHVNA